jgi:cell division protein FtsL
MVIATQNTQEINKEKTDTKKPKQKKYNKNIVLIDQLFLYAIFMAVLVSSIYVLYSYVDENITKTNNDLTTLQEYSDKLSNDIVELENKARVSKKYIAIWDTIPENKKQINGIQLSDIKTLLDELTKKYGFKNIQINAETPESLSGDFLREKIRASTSLITITFDSLLDSNIYDFINETMNKLDGFTLIESISITQQEQITDQYLITLSDNKDARLPIKAIIKIRLYGLNKK